jgi:hypothetical protein
VTRLEVLREQLVFDPYPRFADLGALHVPFDDLLGNAAVEATVLASSRRGGRAALVGPSGSGKSSVVSATLGPLAEGVVPILVPLALADAATVVEPSSIVDQVIATIASDAAARGRLPEDAALDARLVNRRVHRSTSRAGGLSTGWPMLDAHVALELTRQLEGDLPRAPSERASILQRLLETISEADHQPVLIFDDTDRWLPDSGIDEPDRLVRAFFSRVLRWINELPCSLVVAVHEHYLLAAPDLLDPFDTIVRLPRLPDPRSLEAVLQHRIDIADPALGSVFDADAIDLIFVHNRQGSLRRSIRVAHAAVVASCDLGLDVVPAAVVQSVVADADRT